jgi:hypothetical protein
MATTMLTIPGNPRITLCETKYLSQREYTRIVDALCILSYVLESQRFKEKLLVMKYTSTKLDIAKISEILYQGKELVTGSTGSFGMDHSDIDNELDFVMSCYTKRWSKVIGYTIPGKITNWINRKYLTSMKPWALAGHLFHEKLHQLGFHHSSASDHKSVPYALGYLVRDLGEQDALLALNKKRALVETVIHTGGK